MTKPMLPAATASVSSKSREIPKPPAAVLMCVYAGDRADWFDQAMASILNQSHGKEFIRIYLGVNGPIPGALEAVVEKYRDGIHRIVRSPGNKFLGGMLNRLIEVLDREPYVFRMDADDLCHPDRFSRQIRFLEENPSIDILGTSILEFSDENSATNVRDYFEKPAEIFARLYKGAPVAHPSVCFRRAALNRLGGYDAETRMSQDIEMWFRAAGMGMRFANLKEPLLYFRCGEKMFRRRSLEKAFYEFRIYWKGCLNLYGPSWKSLFPVLRLGTRLLPVKIIRSLYAGPLRKALLSPKPAPSAAGRAPFTARRATSLPGRLRAWTAGREDTLKTSAAMFGNQAFNVVLNVLLTAILARTLSMSDMGWYQLLLSYIALGQMAALPGMDVVINKSVIKRMDAAVFPALKRGFLFACAGAVAVGAAGWLLHSGGRHEEMGRNLLLVTLFIPLKGLEKYDSILTGKRKFLLSRRLNTFSSLLSIAVMGTVSFTTGKVVWVVASLFLVKSLATALGLFLALRMLRRDPLPRSDVDGMLRQGWTQTVFNVANIAVGQLDKVVLGVMDPRLLAVYYVGNAIPLRIRDNLKGMFGVVLTRWSALSKRENLEKIRKHMKWMLLLGAGVTLLVWLVTPILIPLLYGPAYTGSVRIAQLLSLTLALSFFSFFMANVDVYQNRGRFWNMQTVARQCVYLALLACLIPRYHIHGVVFAILAADVFNAGLSYWQFRRSVYQTVVR